MNYARLLARFLLTHLTWKPVALDVCLCGGGICEGTQDKSSKRYTCRGCDRSVPWCFGASDNMPFHCDDCWALDDAHPMPPILNFAGAQSRK